MSTHSKDIQGVEKQLWNLPSEPLVPHFVAVHVLPGRRNLKVPLNDETKAVASKREIREHVLVIREGLKRK